MKKNLPELFKPGLFNKDNLKISKAIYTHDLSKFGKSEYKTYKDFQNIRNKNLSDEEYDKSKTEFNKAWNHHQKRNKHHWQY